jgi:hypothetical protein
MGLYEKQYLRRIHESLKHEYPISYKLNRRLTRLTDPFERKVSELFECHTLFTQGWMVTINGKWTHHRKLRDNSQEKKQYTEKQMLRLISQHFDRTMASIKKMESERVKK